MKRLRRRIRGFTLIELMVTIAVAAILMMVAVPSFVTFRRNSELTSIVNSMVGAIASARTEAMKRNLPVLVTPLGTGWASGWRTFVDLDRSKSYTAGDLVVMTQTALQPYFSVSGSGTAAGTAPYLRFDGSGFTSPLSGDPTFANMAISRSDLSGAAQLTETRYLILAMTGRARVCKPASATDTTCSATSTN
jgi:type IV fimbrial biogenesis protein FimT